MLITAYDDHMLITAHVLITYDFCMLKDTHILNFKAWPYRDAVISICCLNSMCMFSCMIAKTFFNLFIIYLTSDIIFIRVVWVHILSE